MNRSKFFDEAVEFLEKHLEEKGFNQKRIIFLHLGGSFLYQTQRDDGTSDVDLKGLFLPSGREMILGKAPDNLQFKFDVDGSCFNRVECELFSLTAFINMVSHGETQALEMLSLFHTGKHHQIAWDNLDYGSSFLGTLFDKMKPEPVDGYEQYPFFVTQNAKAFMGYAKSQAVKYSAKGERLKHWMEFYNVVSSSSASMLLNTFNTFYDSYKHTEYDFIVNGKLLDPHPTAPNVKMYHYMGISFPVTIKLVELMQIVNQQIQKFGKRSHSAMEGKDWKALSHALRVSTEMYDLYSLGYITFDGNHASKLRKVKEGKLPVDEVMKDVDGYLAEVEDLVEINKFRLPERLDYDKMEDVVYTFLALYFLRWELK